MGRVALVAAGASLVVAAACGARTDMPLDERGPTLLTPATISGQSGAAGKAGAGGASSGAGGASAGAAGASSQHPCGDCVAKFGPTGCAPQLAACQGAPACAALNACLVTNGCLEGPDVFACGKKLCPSFISADVSWAPFAQCAVCIPACAKECGVTGFACDTPISPCAHGLCQTGAPLDPGCDPCVAETCAQRPQCCNPASSAGWTVECAMLANSLCGICFEK